MNKKLNICFCSCPDYSSHAKALYLYMKKRYKDNMNLIWVIKNENNVNYMKEKNIDFILYESKEFKSRIKNMDIIFTTHCDLVDYKSNKAFYIELWHGIGIKPIGFLMNSIDYFDKWWLKKATAKIDYFIVPSEFWIVLFSAMLNVKKNRILPLGYPKFDFMVGTNSKIYLSKVLNIDVNKYKKIIFYTPTIKKTNWKDSEVPINNENIFNFNKYDENVLLDYLEKNNYLLCIKHHPDEEVIVNFNDNKYVKNILETELIKNDITITELLNSADLLISDYSSLIIEFLFLNKPVIYLNNDLDIYQKNRGIFFENYDFWTIGLRATNINELILNVKKSLDKKYNINNYNFDEKKSLWYSNLTDGGCDKICNYLFVGNKLNNKLVKYIDIESNLNNKIDELNNVLNEKNLKIEYIEKELNQFYNSKTFKVMSLLIRLKSKLFFWKQK